MREPARDAFFGKPIVRCCRPSPAGAAPRGQDSGSFEFLQPVRKEYSVAMPSPEQLKVAKCAIAAHHHVANQEQRPAITE